MIYTKNYLDIQKYRFGEKFDYNIEIDKDLESCAVPKLIIQPRIENAIKHGYTQTEKMTIYIKAKRVKNILMMVVYNNGKGMEKEVLHEIKERLKKNSLEIRSYRYL